MLYITIIAVIIAIVMIGRSKKASQNQFEKSNPIEIPVEIPQETNISATGKYKSKWLFSYNEKDVYKKLKEIIDKHGLYLCAKVRLLDLIEPISGIPQYKTYFYKIQAKHVDFVICDTKLVAKCIIELDDNSHQSNDRKTRDTFVDEAVTSAGYTIIHILGVNPDNLESQILQACNIKTISATIQEEQP